MVVNFAFPKLLAFLKTLLGGTLAERKKTSRNRKINIGTQIEFFNQPDAGFRLNIFDALMLSKH